MTEPVMTTERLELWRPRAEDIAGVAAIVAPDAVRRHLGNREPNIADEFARVLRNAGSWGLYGYGNFHVRERGRDPIVGICGVFHSWRGFGQGFDDTPEVGWIMAHHVWGQGYAGEAAQAALGWFDRTHGPRRVACMIEPDNTASLRLAAKLGFTAYGKQDFDGSTVLLLQRNE